MFTLYIPLTKDILRDHLSIVTAIGITTFKLPFKSCV